MITWLGGMVGVPSAVRRNASTTTDAREGGSHDEQSRRERQQGHQDKHLQRDRHVLRVLRRAHLHRHTRHSHRCLRPCVRSHPDEKQEKETVMSAEVSSPQNLTSLIIGKANVTLEVLRSGVE
jgi:hypothetical protein